MEARLENRFDAPIPAIAEKQFLEQVSHEISRFDAVRRAALSANARRILDGYGPVADEIAFVP